jgi:hypothetical protein
MLLDNASPIKVVLSDENTDAVYSNGQRPEGGLKFSIRQHGKNLIMTFPNGKELVHKGDKEDGGLVFLPREN